MTTETTAPIKPKLANTTNGWAIALLPAEDRYGEPFYEIARVAPDNKYLVLIREDDYQTARKIANAYYRADKYNLPRDAPFTRFGY